MGMKLWLSDKAAQAMREGDPKVVAEQQAKAMARAWREADARAAIIEKRLAL
jgi:hypothetical protein